MDRRLYTRLASLVMLEVGPVPRGYLGERPRPWPQNALET